MLHFKCFAFCLRHEKAESQLAVCVLDDSVPSLPSVLVTFEINTSLVQLLSPPSPLIAHLHNAVLGSLDFLYLHILMIKY